MIVMARAGPMVENTPSFAKVMPKNVIATVPADAAITLPIDPRGRHQGDIRFVAHPEVFVVSRDEEDRVVRPRAQHHPAHQDHGLRRDAQAHLCEPGDDLLGERLVKFRWSPRATPW